MSKERKVVEWTLQRYINMNLLDNEENIKSW